MLRNNENNNLNNSYNHLSEYKNDKQVSEPKPSGQEDFTNMNPVSKVNFDLVLKALFFGAIFYLLSLPEVYKMTKKCCKSVDGVLLHSIVFAVVYYVVMHFI